MPRFADKLLVAGLDSLRNLVCPPECVWCGTPTASGIDFCSECRPALLSQYYHCQRCATPLPNVVPNGDCFRCRHSGWKFSRVVTLGPYRGRRREAVILAKKRSFESLRLGIGRLLAELIMQQPAVVQQPPLPPLIVPVPYHWTHAFSGTARTANSLAQAIGQHNGWPVKTRIARRIRKTAKQGMLSWTERKQNVRGAFEIRQAKVLSGRHVLLVDDVLTSGATAGELAGRLVRAGAREVSVVVIARGTGTKDRSAEVNAESVQPGQTP